MWIYDSNKFILYDRRGYWLSTGVYTNCYSESVYLLSVIPSQSITYLNPWKTKYCKNKKKMLLW